MPSVFDKLNHKDGQDVVVINAPESFESELKTLGDVTVHRDLKNVKAIQFALAFAETQAEVDKLALALTKKSEGDVVLWFAYPKGTSKRYTCDFNRDTGWKILRDLGFDTVRQVAIDEDWTALRFRRIEFIKSSTRR